MTGLKRRDKVKERNQDIARINQLYVQQLLEDGNSLSLCSTPEQNASPERNLIYQSLMFNAKIQGHPNTMKKCCQRPIFKTTKAEKGSN